MADRDLDYIFTHVFLPARVPHANDQGNGFGDRALTDLLVRLVPLFRDANDAQYYQQWSIIHRTLRTFATLHQHNNSLSKSTLSRAFQDVKDGGVVLLHIAVQNSALIIRKNVSEYLIESFETASPAATVLSTSGALQWDFPSKAVAMPVTSFEDPSFQASFTDFLERASVEPVKQFAATSHKARVSVYESRDTTTPAIVGQLLMSLLEANGSKYTPVLTRKRVRDEISWSDGAENPWRRSSTWMILRVCLQRCLCFLLGGSVGNLHYKFFMCFVLSSVCEDLYTAKSILADRLAFSRSKLARRLAKLQHESELAPPRRAKAMGEMFTRHEKRLKHILQLVNERLHEMWTQIRGRNTKRILTLPRRADQDSTVLSLSHSRAFLQRILGEALYGRPPPQLCLEQRIRNIKEYPVTMEARNTRSATDYLHLADMESNLKLTVARYADRGPDGDFSEFCMDINHKLQNYQHAALPGYQDDPEQISLMLLIMMELWQVLDSVAITTFPLLARYDPGFPPNLLHCLQVSQLEDMRRLQNVEAYLEDRRSAAQPSLPSIFGEVTRDSFVVQYFDQCHRMQDLLTTIENADRAATAVKEEEWRRETAIYEDIVRDAAQTACLFIEDDFDPLLRQHDDRRCRKHYLERRAKRMKIMVHEAMLPNEITTAKALIFELLLPAGFAGWRDATWRILQLARGDIIADQPPKSFLRDYPALKSYMEQPLCTVTVASRTKSFQNTHYCQVPFPVSFEGVCRPHALKYGLYDHEKGIWTARHSGTPSFADLCKSPLSSESIYASLQRYLHPTFEGKAVSGNEVVASQTRCPNYLTIAEFTSFQDLRLGSGVQWITLLRELASPSLNFGTVEVSMLVAQLALMAGPPEGRSHLRANHWIFRDPGFCSALAAQIEKRLSSITSNWREGQTIECMLTLLLRIWSLATSDESAKEAEHLILSIRKMTHEWTHLLHDEICNATDVETAQKRSQNAFLAAILARKTFTVEATNSNGLIQPDNLTCFLECGFTLKDNLPKNEAKNVAKMSPSRRRLFIGDLKLVHRIENQLRRSVEVFPEAVNHAVSNVWADAGGDFSRKYTQWTFLSAPHNGWLTAKSTSGEGLLEQSIHLDIFGGALLIDGQPLGRLPEDYTKQQFFQQLFGTRIFLTYPSNMRGMSYRLATLFQGYEVHFGFRGIAAFIRARKDGRILEWIPSTVFHSNVSGDPPDFPLPLIHECAHWLDLGSHVLEIRPYISMWQAKYSDWRVDLHISMARRRGSLLVDPRSSIFNRVATVIEPFEHRSSMTVFQPEKNNLSLQLPKLELQFRVNRGGLLESQQLRAAIDFNQDAGTFYGLKSCLVLRDCTVPEDRSIIVAMGPAEISSNQNDNHVRIQTNHTGYYARFFINQTLGRLECAAEPRLIYFKAYCHAVTAFVLPDPLTRRTGTDEAIHCLEAGNARPWAPLDRESYRLLSSIAELTPQRMYYPEDRKSIGESI